MQSKNPHYVLYSEASVDAGSRPRWKFVLQLVGEEKHFSAADAENETRTSRLELLAVVRGLEALDQPSRVTVLTRSRYVRRGIRRELNQWRERRWRWERFGKLVPIRDSDLWQRVDRALEFHQIECCAWSNDESDSPAASGSIAAAIGRVGQTVISSISSIWRPPFTRAA
jgi:ribonuclease HI